MSRSATPGPLSSLVHRQEQLMDRMMRTLAIDRAAAVRLDCGCAFALARTQCLHCRNGRACAAWLDALDPSDRAACPPPFCAAAAFFQRLAYATLEAERRRKLA
jgi:hypothetical protein